MAMIFRWASPNASQAAILAAVGSTRAYSRVFSTPAKAESSLAPVVSRIFPSCAAKNWAAWAQLSTVKASSPAAWGRTSRRRGIPAFSQDRRMLPLTSTA